MQKEPSKDREEIHNNDIFIIPQSPKYAEKRVEERNLRVCAYCRVSTENEVQLYSYELQCSHYTKFITANPKWSFAGIYADEGISGTNRRKRIDFNRMIQDCKDGKIDMIVCKSVTRFARNVVDCLSVVRELESLNPSVGVLFENDNINTFYKGHELYLTIIAAFAEGDSRQKSESILWSIQHRFEDGRFLFPTNALLGYEKVNGELVIEPYGAETVRIIYVMFLAGFSCAFIAHMMTSLRRPTGSGNMMWTPSTVRNILKNERYAGAIVAQKTYTKSFIEHTSGKNRGQMQFYYKENHHEGIVTLEEHVRALLLLASKRSGGLNPQYTITVVRKGLLSGFIPMNRAFGGYETAHYVKASQTAEKEICSEYKTAKIVVFPGCQVVRTQDLVCYRKATAVISNNAISFNKECVCRLQGVNFAEILLHPTEKLLAVRPCDETNKNGFRWQRAEDDRVQPATVSASSLCNILYELMGWQPSWRLKLMAVSLSKNDESILIFDLRETEFRIFLEMPTEEGKKRHRTSLLPEEWRGTFGESMPKHMTSCRLHRADLFGEWETDAKGLPVKGFENNAPICSDEDIQKKINAFFGGDAE